MKLRISQYLTCLMLLAPFLIFDNLGKKNYLADEGAMVKAEKLLYSELATVFGIDESEVTDFVEKNRK